jgi:glycosyltransferase involved in cell wall biosynthesis
MLRVLHLITELNTGGAEIMLFKLLSCMDAKKIAPLVVSLSGDGPVGKQIRELGIDVRFLGFRPGRFSLSGFFDLCGTIRRFKPDIIQTWLYHADFIGTLAALITKKKGLFWNIRCSNMELHHYGRSSRWVSRACIFLSKYPDAVIYNSSNAFSFHQRIGYQRNSHYIIPNGFDTKIFRPDSEIRRRYRQKYHISPGQPVLGLIARFDPMKDHISFFQAAALVKKALPDIRLILCGNKIDWENHELVKMIQDSQLKENTLLLGLQHDMRGIMNMLDIAVSASAYGEGFSNAVGEAMACGVPCVVTDVGDSARIVGDTGKIVPPGSPEKLSEAILEIVQLPRSEFDRLKRRCRARIVEKYTIDRIAAQYERLYLDFCCR